MTNIPLSGRISVLTDRINYLENELSEQKKIQESLIISESNLTAILEQNADGIVIVDKEGIVLYVNPSAELLFNRNKKEFLGALFGFPVSTNKEDCSLVIMSGGIFVDVEFRVVEVQWPGQSAFQISVHDITKLKRAEEQLIKVKEKAEESEAKFRKLFNRVGDAIFNFNPNTFEILEANKATSEIYGYSYEELIGMSCLKFSAEVEQSKLAAESIKNNEIVKVNLRHHKKKDGSDVFVELNNYKILVNGKNTFYSVCHDITNIKKTESELIIAKEIAEESKERIKSILENSADAIFIADNNGKYVYTNKAVTELLGFSPEEMKRKTSIDLAPKNRRDERLEIFKRLKIEGKAFAEIALLKKDGNSILTDLNAVILPGDLAYISCRDITDRKHLEQEKEILTYNLNERVKELTCLYAIGSIFETADISMDILLNRAVKVIPSGYQYPDICGAKIIIDDDEYQTANYRRTEWKMSADIKIIGEKSGTVEISYTEEKEEIDEGPFLKEERDLLNLIAEKIGHIIERKTAEEQQIIQTTALEAAAFSVIITNAEGIILWVNNAFAKITGYSKEEAIGKTPDILNSGKHDKSFFKNMWDTIKAGNVWHGEVLNKRKDGRLLTDEMTITPVRDKDGIVQNFIALKQDITERKRVSEALRENEQLLSRTQQIANIGSFRFSFNGTESTWTDEMYNIFGVQKDTFKITNESFINIIHPDDRSSMVNWIEQTTDGQNTRNLEFRIVRPDGAIRFINGTGILQKDKYGKPHHIIGSAQDITERKNIEIEIQNLNANLELKVEERTKKLSEVNIHLIEAKAQAEQANKAKSEFLSNMSHEIRTPMNAVLGYSELLSNILEDKTQKDYLESIRSSGKTLLTLINDILDLSKIEAEKLELTFDYVNTRSFFSEFERIFSWKLAEKDLTFILDIVSGIPAGIYIDETRLRQIILNIISNAFKFTKKGHIKLKVYIENPPIVQLSNKKSEEYIDLVVEIEDTGIGISSEFQEHIFEPFSQEEHKNEFGGTGLGLAITRQLLALMNGTISLKSELNKGSTFQIKIPNIIYLRDFEKRTDTIQTDPANIVFEKATILIADDIDHNRNYFVDALKNTNIKIVEVKDGLTAYSLVKDIVPDLIITDLRMPMLDGFGLLKKIQGNAKLSHIPVIAYSAFAMKEQKEHIFNSEFSGLLIKPVRVTDLYIELMNHLPYKSIQPPEKDTSSRQGLLEEITDMQGLIHSLETVYTDVWNKFKVRQPMGEVREFGENLELLGNAHNAEIIKKYGNELMLAAENFNIESILKLLNKYRGIVKKIIEYHSNN